MKKNLDQKIDISAENREIRHKFGSFSIIFHGYVIWIKTIFGDLEHCPNELGKKKLRIKKKAKFLKYFLKQPFSEK